MRRRLWIVPAALLFGVWLSIAYVNPYENTMSLSYLVMQLSGARGNFTMGLNMSELLAFTLRLVPTLVFQACAGISLYRHYCTASVYIFSRIPNRLRWYGRETAALALQALAYQGLILGAVIVTAVLRWEVVPDGAGWQLLACHWLIWSVWTFAFTMGINLLAIYWGSSGGFAALAGLQVVCVSLLIALKPFEEDFALLSTLKRVNPITCLILCWQTSRFAGGGGGIYLADSLALVLLLAAAVAAAGAVIVRRHDLLISDTDGG